MPDKFLFLQFVPFYWPYITTGIHDLSDQKENLFSLSLFLSCPYSSVTSKALILKTILLALNHSYSSADLGVKGVYLPKGLRIFFRKQLMLFIYKRSFSNVTRN
jgi:hypothetical protein